MSYYLDLKQQEQPHSIIEGWPIVLARKAKTKEKRQGQRGRGAEGKHLVSSKQVSLISVLKRNDQELPKGWRKGTQIMYKWMASSNTEDVKIEWLPHHLQYRIGEHLFTLVEMLNLIINTRFFYSTSSIASHYGRCHSPSQWCLCNASAVVSKLNMDAVDQLALSGGVLASSRLSLKPYVHSWPHCLAEASGLVSQGFSRTSTHEQHLSCTNNDSLLNRKYKAKKNKIT